MTRIETLKAQVVILQEGYENDMTLLKEIISERAEKVFRLIDLTKSIYTDDVVSRMIYNQITEMRLIKRIEVAYQQIERSKTIINTFEIKYRRPVTFELDYYNYTTNENAKAIEECIIKLYYTKRKVSVYSLGITDYTHRLIDEEIKKRKNS